MSRPALGKWGVLAALSGGSLAACGASSLLVSAALGSISGLLIGLALVGHGLYELRQRRRALARADFGAFGRMAWNQVLLAISVSLYLVWQFAALDQAALEAMLLREPLQSALALYPPEARMSVRRNLPTLVASVYALALAGSVAGCLAMALYYRRASQRFTSGQPR